jgi:Leucine Rich repeat
MLRGLNGLQHLGLRSCQSLDDAGMRAVTGLTSLESLDLGDCGVRDEFKELARLRSLTTVDVSDGTVPTKAVAALAGFDRLRTVKAQFANRQ